MGADAFRWDVFLSYASEDRAWVEANLYRPLKCCHTADGRRAEIFFDTSEEGLQTGMSWMYALDEAIKTSRKAVPVYSSRYFQKDMTGWELTKFFQRDPGGMKGFINPVLIETAAEGKVPSAIDHIQYVRLTVPDWFERLTKVLGLSLTLPQDRFQLRLDGPPVPDEVVNHTLPPVRVALIGQRGLVTTPEVVTLAAEGGKLQGTLEVQAEAGVATFVDLSIAEATARTRLVARAPGCEPVYGNPFAVTAPADPPPAPASAPSSTRRRWGFPPASARRSWVLAGGTSTPP